MSVTAIKSPTDVTLADFRAYDSTIFLGGGISNCPDWQSEFITAFSLSASTDNRKFLLVNPRRNGNLARTGGEAERQIQWERTYLQECSHIIFWFPKESICPITLFELGQYATKDRLLHNRTIVGVEVGYQREFDLRTQLSLICEVKYPIQSTVYNLARMAFINSNNKRN